MIPIGAVLSILIPLARKFGKALRKDSPGGKKITPEEVLEILLGEADGITEKLAKL